VNCINCNLEISPSFVASIRDNKCPACGKACLSDADHGAIFSVVSLITSSTTDMAEDTTIKLATALHGKFDIFPKGVVVDGQVTKEVVYVTTGPSSQPTAGMRRPAPLPVRKARVAPEQTSPELPGEQLTPAQLAKLRQFQQLQEQTVDVEEDESVVFDGPLSDDLRDAEALRLARQKIAKMRAEHAGVKG
jgi:hypothetical protein